MIAYKIVYRLGDNFISCIIMGKHVIKYKLHEWIKTDHACCFDTLENARKFFVKNTSLLKGCCRIYKCEIELSKTYRVRSCFITQKKKLSINKKKYTLDDWPIGTIFASKVKLLKELV